VAGRPISQSTLLLAAALDFTEFSKCASLLRAEHLAQTATEQPQAMEMYHSRVQAAVLAALDDESKRSTHARLAEAMETTAKDDFEALATHHGGAGNRIKAAIYAERAGAQAWAALAFDRAARLYAHALENTVDPTAA